MKCQTIPRPPCRPACLEAALSYAKRGWPVLPVRPREKQPLTPHGVKDATTDEAIIRGWWAKWPEANVAIAAGEHSGLFVLDVDPRHGAMKPVSG